MAQTPPAVNGRKPQRSRGQGTLFKRVKGGPWIASWFEHNGDRPERSTHTTDKRTAEQILARHVADAALRKAGVIDPAAESVVLQSKRSIEEHLADFEAKMKADGRTRKHIAGTLAYVRALARAADWETAGQIAADGLVRHVGELRGAGRSARAVNAHVTAAKSFTRWLVAQHRLPVDPLAAAGKLNAKADRRRPRRALDVEELELLLEAARKGPERLGMSGQDRARVYALAVQAGLRAAEVRSLRWRDFDLAADPPTVTVQAAYAKNRRQDTLPLKPATAAMLARWRDSAGEVDQEARPFGTLPEKTATMLREDLDAARGAWLEQARTPAERQKRERSDFLAYSDDAGRVADFHALRHTFITGLARNGVHPKVAQQLARHSTITLTMDHYTHTVRGDEAAALAALPELSVAEEPEEKMRATGTDDASADVRDLSPPLYPQQLGRNSQLLGAKPCEAHETGRVGQSHPSAARQALVGATDSEQTRGNAKRQRRTSSPTPPGTRTPDPLIKSQLLYQLS